MAAPLAAAGNPSSECKMPWLTWLALYPELPPLPMALPPHDAARQYVPPVVPCTPPVIPAPTIPSSEGASDERARHWLKAAEQSLIGWPSRPAPPTPSRAITGTARPGAGAARNTRAARVLNTPGLAWVLTGGALSPAHPKGRMLAFPS